VALFDITHAISH